MKRAHLALFALAACHSGPPKWTSHDDDAHARLIRLQIATDGIGFTPPDQVAPARFDEGAVATSGELNACPKRIETAVRRWANKHQLVASREEVRSQDVVFHFVAGDGRFELTYKRTHFTALYPRAWPVPANENKEVLAQTELVYTTRPANAGADAITRLIATYDIERLMHELYGSMSCDAAGNPPKLVRPD